MIILNFHGIGEPGPHVAAEDLPYWLPVDRLSSILDLVRPVASRIMITFDDGNESDVEHALPLLQHCGLRADFFVLSARVGLEGSLSAEGIRRLRAAGMGIGSHGHRHVKWTTLPDDELAGEVSRSLDILGGIIGEPVRTVGVPFGHYDRRVLAVLRRAGIVRVYTSGEGCTPKDRWLLPRNTIRNDRPLSGIARLIETGDSPLGRLKSDLRRLKNGGLWP